MPVYLKAVVLAVVEGLTEFLPISSTGHLILVERWLTLGLSDEFTKAFCVIIQLPAILAVVIYFWGRLWPLGKESAEQRATFVLWAKIVVAVLPAVVLGVLFDKRIEATLMWEIPVAVALLLGGIVLVAIEMRPPRTTIVSLEGLSYRNAFLIGVFQCAAMWPGTSRSAATIIGAMLLGAGRPVAAEFSFLLAIPTMLGATALTLAKHAGGFSGEEWRVLAAGSVVSFLVAYAVVAFFMRYVRTRDFKVFGYYRILLAAVVVGWYLLRIMSGRPAG